MSVQSDYGLSAEGYLSYIRKLKKEAESLRRRIRRRTKDAETLRATDYSAVRVSGGMPVTLADKVASIQGDVARLDDKLAWIARLTHGVIVLIDKLNDPYHRIVLSEYYLDGVELQNLADSMGLSYRQAKRIKSEALVEFEKIYGISQNLSPNVP